MNMYVTSNEKLTSLSTTRYPSPSLRFSGFGLTCVTPARTIQSPFCAPGAVSVKIPACVASGAAASVATTMARKIFECITNSRGLEDLCAAVYGANRSVDYVSIRVARPVPSGAVVIIAQNPVRIANSL
jgi:hypothetical protein